MEAKTLALYLGCQCKVFTSFPDGMVEAGYNAKLGAVNLNGLVKLELNSSSSLYNDVGKGISEIKLLLRPLSSITEEENQEIRSLAAFDENIRWLKFTGEVAKYLLSKGFDLFGLIEKGEAIDSTTVNPKN